MLLGLFVVVFLSTRKLIVSSPLVMSETGNIAADNVHIFIWDFIMEKQEKQVVLFSVEKSWSTCATLW